LSKSLHKDLDFWIKLLLGDKGVEALPEHLDMLKYWSICQSEIWKILFLLRIVLDKKVFLHQRQLHCCHEQIIHWNLCNEKVLDIWIFGKSFIMHNIIEFTNHTRIFGNEVTFKVNILKGCLRNTHVSKISNGACFQESLHLSFSSNDLWKSFSEPFSLLNTKSAYLIHFVLDFSITSGCWRRCKVPITRDIEIVFMPAMNYSIMALMIVTLPSSELKQPQMPWTCYYNGFIKIGRNSFINRLQCLQNFAGPLESIQTDLGYT